MDAEKVLTVIASIVGVFWIVLQIIAHAREKGHQNLLTAALIVCIGCVPVAWFLFGQRVPANPSPTVPPAATLTRSRAALAPPPLSNTPPAAPLEALASPAPVDTASGAASVTPTSVEAVAKPSPTTSSAPALDHVETAFQVVFNHNLVGGLSQVLLRCTFTVAGPQPVTLTAYHIKVHVRLRGQSASQDHVFDRVLGTPLQVAAGSAKALDVPVDAEIRVLLVAYRKEPSDAWVRLTWSGTQSDGQAVEAASDNNAPPGPCDTTASSTTRAPSKSA